MIKERILVTIQHVEPEFDRECKKPIECTLESLDFEDFDGNRLKALMACLIRELMRLEGPDETEHFILETCTAVIDIQEAIDHGAITPEELEEGMSQ